MDFCVYIMDLIVDEWLFVETGKGRRGEFMFTFFGWAYWTVTSYEMLCMIGNKIGFELLMLYSMNCWYYKFKNYDID